MPDVAGLGACAEIQRTFQSRAEKSLLKQRGGGRTCLFFKMVTFAHFKKVELRVILVKIPQYMHLLVIPVFYSGEG